MIDPGVKMVRRSGMVGLNSRLPSTGLRNVTWTVGGGCERRYGYFTLRIRPYPYFMDYRETVWNNQDLFQENHALSESNSCGVNAAAKSNTSVKSSIRSPSVFRIIWASTIANTICPKSSLLVIRHRRSTA